MHFNGFITVQSSRHLLLSPSKCEIIGAIQILVLVSNGRAKENAYRYLAKQAWVSLQEIPRGGRNSRKYCLVHHSPR